MPRTEVNLAAAHKDLSVGEHLERIRPGRPERGRGSPPLNDGERNAQIRLAQPTEGAGLKGATGAVQIRGAGGRRAGRRSSSSSGSRQHGRRSTGSHKLRSDDTRPALVASTGSRRFSGRFAVILALPVASAVATLIEVLVLGHEPPATRERRSLRSRRTTAQRSYAVEAGLGDDAQRRRRSQPARRARRRSSPESP